MGPLGLPLSPSECDWLAHPHRAECGTRRLANLATRAAEPTGAGCGKQRRGRRRPRHCRHDLVAPSSPERGSGTARHPRPERARYGGHPPDRAGNRQRPSTPSNWEFASGVCCAECPPGTGVPHMNDQEAGALVTRAVRHFTYQRSLAATLSGERHGMHRPRVWMAASLGVVLVVGVVFFGPRGTPGAPPVSYADWQATPTTPDAALAAAAPASCGLANFGAAGAPLKLQDQRGGSAAMLFATNSQMVVCLLAHDAAGKVVAGVAGASRFATQPHALEVTGRLTVPATTGDPGLSVLAGRVDASIAQVFIKAGSSGTVTASVSGGFFLAWWPSAGGATSILGLDAAGSTVATGIDPEAP